MDAGERRNVRSSKTNKKGGKGPQVRSAAEEAKRREVLKEALREKLELEQRALQVVERLLDDSVTEEFLIDCARMITPANYKDAVEERSIVKMCGYPVCPNKLTNVPAQQYKISTKTNKVYDITERKCFCSNFCYKASKCFEVQISKSPLWLRKEERPPDIKLMKKGDGGSSGLEVKLTDKPVSEADIENPVSEPAEVHGGSSGPSDSSDVEQDFVSSVVAKEGSKAIVHWGKLPKRDGGSEEEQLREGQIVKDKQEQNLKPQEENHDEANKPSRCSPERNDVHSFPSAPDRDTPVEETRKLLDQFALSDRSVTPQNAAADVTPEICDANANTKDAPDTNLNISHVGMSKKSAAGLKSLLKNHIKAKTEASPVTLSLLESLRVTLTEWRTEETMTFLHGPDYTSQTEPTSQSEEEEELDEDDLEDVVEKPAPPAGRQARPTAAAPDYETLRKETELMDVRVQEFYKGVCVLPEELTADKGTEDVDKDPPLPPVDSHAQRLLQKRIVVEKLSRSLRDVVGPLHVTMSEIINDINNLVRTFRFTNVNIIHKPPEWTLISVVLLSVLTEVSPLLKESMAKASSVEYISSLMKELRLTEQDLQSLVQLFKPSRHTSSTHPH
ncbi:putative RNA polymerase II subunit B1 CTD phosphatase rpap2 [Colossoma macropomum]|uniref:putative RNA polymerase II subunit B1 CTD phosphatase rpap2 n=1 Tax=Colossoma macropomum TaxID=42526 RepID=UPI0018644625|nr:putative RNA polymerase II subunit B1 CTD phosphatase rpap2 [Colossoma macropomum]